MHSAVLKTGDLVHTNNLEALEDLPVGSTIATTDHTHTIWQKICQYLDENNGIRDTWRTPTGEEKPSEDLNNTEYPYQIIYLPNEQDNQ